jgi:MoxR-like ATPase
MAAMSDTQTPAEVREKCDAFRATFGKLVDEIGKVVVGHKHVVEGVLICLFSGGNVLLEGVPGLGKTLLVRTLSQCLHLPFSRIQFTPDLMPADVIGTNIVTEDPATGRRGFQFQKGPIFAQVVLADEINRATPKTQSALLEAMQEHAVTSSGTTYRLNEPFIVLATQNPIEQEGTYPLPEAQLDRFMFKIVVGYSQLEDLMTILDRTTGQKTPESLKILDGPRNPGCAEAGPRRGRGASREGVCFAPGSGDASGRAIRRGRRWRADQQVHPLRCIAACGAGAPCSAARCAR